MHIRELIVKYDYLKNKGGIIELEEELKELEESKYSIRPNRFNERVQESRVSNDRIENINAKIKKLKIKISDSKAYVKEVDFSLRRIFKEEFEVVFDLYTIFNNERKLKEVRGVSGTLLYSSKESVGKMLNMIADIYATAFF